MAVLSDILLRVLLFIAGASLVVYTLFSAIRNFVLPRSAPDSLAFVVFRGIRRLFNLRLHMARTYEQRDAVMAYYAPISLMALLPVWYLLIMSGYAVMFRAVATLDWSHAVRLSISSVMTIGFEPAKGVLTTFLVFSEAVIGLIMVALLLAYLPSMYAAFSRRESAVTLLEVRAGDPPSAVEMIKRYHRIHGLDHLTDVWRSWEAWFADVEESHTSLAALVFFRSPLPNHSWVTASGAVLDGAALTLAVVDIPNDPQAALCIRAGYLALRHIADFFGVEYDPDPRPGKPITIRREEFDLAFAELQSHGVPVKADHDAAWWDYAGWRVNYDQALVAMARITMAPSAPWSSDRPLPDK